MDPLKSPHRIVKVSPNVLRDGKRGFAVLHCADRSQWWARDRETRSGRLPQIGHILDIVGREQKTPAGAKAT